jgi:outer membrane protein
MDQIIRFLVFVILFGNSLHLRAQGIELKSVEDAINYSLEKNPDLEVYKLKTEKSVQEYKIKKRSALPTISGVIDYQNNIEKQTSVLPGDLFGHPGETVYAQLGSQYNYNAGLNITKDMINLERKMEVKLSKLNIEIQSVQRDVFIQLLKEQTAMYYFGALVVKHALEINNANLASSENVLEVTHQKFKEGIIDLPSLNQAKITVNNICQTIKANESLYDNYVYKLKILFDLMVDDTIIFSEKIDIENNQIDFVQDIKEDINLRTFDLQKKQSELDVKLKKAAFLPKLIGTKYFGYQHFNDEGGLSFTNDIWHSNITFGMNLSIPIFGAYKNKGSLKVAKINDRINEQIAFFERKKSKNADALLLKDHYNGLSQLEFTKSNYQLYKKNVELSLQKYNKGTISLEVHLRTYEDYLKAESNYLNSLSAVYTNYSSIRSRQ